MQLRPRQSIFVDACCSALEEHGNSLGIAPTGAGKTVMLSAVAKQHSGRVLILQHRDELVAQNRATFKRMCPGSKSDVFDAGRKRWEDTTFAMMQTLCGERHLDTMPPFDLAIIDEAHHIASPSYKRIIKRLKENKPNVHIFGVTATPSRGDRKGLDSVFTNIADVITLSELIQSGHLVRPRTFVIDCGLREELRGVRAKASDFDMDAVEAIMDKQAVNEKVLEEWKRIAGDRQTVIFCSTIAHGKHVMETFREAGVSVAMVEGEMGTKDRESTLKKFERWAIAPALGTQVLINVAVLTEGWDCQPVSCVVLLRPCSHKSTMLQMIGRGLRKVDPERYPGVHKDNCLILDFGYSLLTHGNLDIDAQLAPPKRAGKQFPCPGCDTLIPSNAVECPMCGMEFNKPEPELRDGGGAVEREALSEFVMTEVELLEVSPYRWEDFWNGVVTIANGITAWVACIHYGGRWISIGGKDGEQVKLIADESERMIALATADDYLRDNGDSDGAKKSKRWLGLPATEKQREMLGYTDGIAAFGLNRYRAACELTWKFNERYIRRRLTEV